MSTKDALQTLYRLGPSGEVLRCLDFDEWATWFEHAERQTALTRVGPAEVSTVFLGIDHSLPALDEDGSEICCTPVLWETMVFGGEHEGTCLRYTSEQLAREGHAKIVAALSAGNHEDGDR